jgi:hypothetical protein
MHVPTEVSTLLTPLYIHVCTSINSLASTTILTEVSLRHTDNAHMTTEASDPNQYRLEAEFQGEYVIHTRPGLPDVEEPRDQEAIDMVQGRWTSGDVIGTGGFGVVLKQKNDSGRLRAVKRISRGALSVKEAGLSWELRVLAKLKDASVPIISG